MEHNYSFVTFSIAFVTGICIHLYTVFLALWNNLHASARFDNHRRHEVLTYLDIE